MKHPLLVLLFALALPAQLSAQKIPTLKPLKEVPEVLLPFEKKGHWGYADQKGKTVIKTVFDAAEGFIPVTADDVTMGVARIRFEGKWGFITKENAYLFLPVYDELTTFDEGGNAIGTAGGTKSLLGVQPALSEKKTFQTLAGVILRMNLDEIEPFNDYGVAKASEQSKWGLVNRKGGWTLPAEFDSLEEQYGMFFLQRGGKAGIAALDGSIQIEPVYDELTWKPDASVFVARKDGKYGIVYSNGKVRYPCIFDKEPVESFRGYVEMWEGNQPALFIPDDRLYTVEEYDDILFRDDPSYVSSPVLPNWMKRHLDKAAPVTVVSELKPQDRLDVSAYDGVDYATLAEITLKNGRTLDEVLTEFLRRPVNTEDLTVFDDGNMLYVGSHVYEDYFHVSVIDMTGEGKGWGENACGTYTILKRDRILADNGQWAGGFAQSLAPLCFNKAGRPHVPVLRYEYHTWAGKPVVFLGHNITPDNDRFESMKDGWKKLITGPTSFLLGDFLHGDSDDYREESFVRIHPVGPDGIAVYEIQQQGIDRNEDYENPSRSAKRTVAYGFIGLTRPFFTEPLFEDARNIEGGMTEVRFDGTWKQQSLKQIQSQDPFAQPETESGNVTLAAAAPKGRIDTNWLEGDWKGTAFDKLAFLDGEENSESPVYLKITSVFYQLSLNGPVDDSVDKVYYSVSKATKDDGQVIYRLIDMDGDPADNELALYFTDGEQTLHLPNGINGDIDFTKVTRGAAPSGE